MTNLVKVNEEAPITWLSSTGTRVITLTSLATLTGRQGAIYDFGVAARTLRWAWRAWVQFATTPVLAEAVRIYWKSAEASAAHPDNDDGTGDAAVSAVDKLNNLKFLGSIIVDEAAQDIEMVASGVLDINPSQGMPVFWNATVDSLTATALEHGFSLTPLPMEIQDAP